MVSRTGGVPVFLKSFVLTLDHLFFVFLIENGSKDLGWNGLRSEVLSGGEVG